MGKLKVKILLCVGLLSIVNCQLSIAQYYDWGPSPANVKWRQIRTPDLQLIYPQDFEANARRVAWYLDTVRTHIDLGFRHGTMHTPVVIHNRNMIGNGMVMWAPKRVELLAAPAATYSEPWLKQLAIHEYRHNVQYNNLRRGVNRVLGWVLGEQALFLGVGQFSIFVLEGDATMMETEMSAFGRGLQPSFTMHYRAMTAEIGGEVGSKNYSDDYWFSGSYRDFVPDHYRLGYQMARWTYNEYGRFIWDDVARYVSRNPQFIVPMKLALRRGPGKGVGQSEIFRRTFADLNDYWRSLPRVSDSSTRVETPRTSYTIYQWPLWLDDGTVVAFKGDLDRPTRIVRVATSGNAPGSRADEETLAYTGMVSSRPVLAAGRLWWTEYRGSVLWGERVFSRLCSYDLATGRKNVYDSDHQLLYPVAVGGGGEMAFVAYHHSGRFSVMKNRASENGFSHDDFRRLDTVYDFPPGVEVTGLAWDNATHALYFIGLDDGGMFLGAVPGIGAATAPVGAPTLSFRRLTPSRHITINDLRAADGWLYFGSIASGKDEAHALDLASGREWRLSTSSFGSFGPSVSPAGGRLAMTTYDRHGYHLAVQDFSAAVEQERRDLPVDLVNPPWRRWNSLPKMDDLVYREADNTRVAGQLAGQLAGQPRGRQGVPTKYRKGLNLFRPHSWVPLDFYPPAAIQESDFQMNLGATVMSQSLLSDMTSWIAVGWGGAPKNAAKHGENKLSRGMMARGGLSYRGLGPVLDMDLTWGGAPQIVYATIPETANVELKKYFSLTTRLSLPMTLSSGYWRSALTPSVEWFYTNGLIFKSIAGSKPPVGELTRGVERLTLGLSYAGQVRTTQKEFMPRWGVTARVKYVTNPTNGDFHNLLSAYVAGYLPGVVRPHSLTVRGAWQETVGRRDDAIFSFRMKELFPRGASWDFSPRRLGAVSADYQLPVWYPEGGWAGIVYFKRVRVNLFGDAAVWKGFGRGLSDNGWRRATSFGGEVILDVNPLRMPASSGVTVRLTIAKPSDSSGVFLGTGLSLPL